MTSSHFSVDTGGNSLNNLLSSIMLCFYYYLLLKSKDTTFFLIGRFFVARESVFLEWREFFCIDIINWAI